MAEENQAPTRKPDAQAAPDSPAGGTAPEPPRGGSEGAAPIPTPAVTEAPAMWPSAPSPAEIAARRARSGLVRWAVILTVLGLGSLADGLPEVAGLIALGGLFAAAHAADLDPTWRRTYELLTLVPPLGGVLVFGYLAWTLASSDLALLSRVVAVAFALAGAVGSAVTAHPPSAERAARWFFGRAEPSLTRHLGAQLTLAGFLLAVPSWFAFASMRRGLLEDPGTLLEEPRLLGGLVGEILLALGAVGCWVRRDLRETFERLGLRRVTRAQLGVVLLGAAALFALNTGGEALQHRFFPELWKSDLEMTHMLGRDMTPAHALLLGLSAGIGEEITLRGALQPRLGIARTALLFAGLHVQYSWFGILLVFTLGVTLGWIRARTSTTTAIIVHAIYDALAVFGS